MVRKRRKEAVARKIRGVGRGVRWFASASGVHGQGLLRTLLHVLMAPIMLLVEITRYISPGRRVRQLIASDIPFARDDANRLLPAMIACLIGFAALLFAVAMSLTNTLTDRSREVIGGLQVEVPRARAMDSAYMENVTADIKRAPGVSGVTVIGQKQMETLLKPWLGDDFELADLPVPVIIDVRTEVKDGKSAVNVPALRASLAKIDSNIGVEDRGPWISHMLQAVMVLQSLVLLVALLLILCVLGMIILVARTNLRLHHKIVDLLHLFGATDDYIMRQFQWNNAWLAARGALIGTAIAAAVFAAASELSERWESPVVPHITISAPHIVMFLVLPLLTAMIAMVATRLTVKSMLEDMH